MTTTDELIKERDIYYFPNAGLVAETGNLKGLIARGCEAFYREIFGDRFWDAMDSVETDDKHHSETVQWHWDSRTALLRGERPPNDWFVNFPTWARANLKTTLGRAMLIVDAMLTFDAKEQGYALIPGGTKAKIRTTALSLERALHAEKVKQYCPQLSQVEKNPYGHSRGWTADFITTKAGYTFHFIGLDEGVAGANMDNVRPTFIMPDDIDSREDSPVISENRFHTFTSEVLPTRQANTLVYWAQNLISRYSVRYRIEKQRVKVLTNRKPSQPIPAVRNLQTEQRTIDGIVKDVVIGGQCTWKIWSLQRVQDEIDTYGLPAFERECQHEVDQSKEGLILYNYDDDVHVISESEFALKYGQHAWKVWRKKPGNDWARTKTDKHANVAGWLMKSPQSSVLPNITFFRPYSFPSDSAPEDVAERLLSSLSKYAYKETTWAQLRKDLLRRANADVHTSTVADKMAFERGELGRTIPKYSKPLLQRCNVQQGEMSHEMDTVRKIYANIYGLGMKGTNPGKHGGTEKFIAELRVDYESPHPLRPGISGYTQWFMIAPDDILRPYQVGDKTVYLPKAYPDAMLTDELVDSDLARFQFRNCRYRDPVLTVTGEVVNDPLKLYDDFFNYMQMAYSGAPLHGDSLTFDQKIDLLIPADTKEALLDPDRDKFVTQLDYEFQKDIAVETLTRPEDRYEDFI